MSKALIEQICSSVDSYDESDIGVSYIGCTLDVDVLHLKAGDKVEVIEVCLESSEMLLYVTDAEAGLGTPSVVVPLIVDYASATKHTEQ